MNEKRGSTFENNHFGLSAEIQGTVSALALEIKFKLYAILPKNKEKYKV